MNGNLLIMAYPYQGSILTSFRWASDYAHPTVYQGNAKLTQISSTISSAHYSLIFRCQNCLQWSQGEEQGAAPTSEGYLVLGCAYSSRSPANGACPNTLIVQQHDSQEIFAARFNNAAVNPSYTAWAAKAASTVTGACGGQTANPTPPTPSCSKKYTVISGDYCYLIAVNNGLTLDQFYTYNPGLICNPLQIGEVVCVKY
ncbi:hypothetical protein B0T17DRAFT_540674 [Bombardia bombarda]|uniref:LysM domain-containing protein n=1 Tax=Bombardia bombarda TaxID=252184 RepID=A0AA39WGF8_9PEZI|nr:hypothetical protein B0T17DRAFT_540674 [Bombardia bombarda]